MEQDDTIPIYEKQENEPAIWYDRFLIYRNMPKRSLLGAYNLYTKRKQCLFPHYWKAAFNTYDWKFRAELYDEHKKGKS